jgi:membrane protein YqaA with SNARE-associated domain
MEWGSLTLWYSALSALIPVFNIELYLVGLVSQQPQLQWWLLGLAAAVGQLSGKTLFYLAGRGSLRLPGWLHGRTTGRGEGRWSRWLQRLHDRFHRTARHRPRWTVAVLLASASIGVPPFAATALIAGLAEVPLPAFLATGLIGRFARFSAIAASPGLIATVFF